MMIIDAHLDLSWNALGWNRDLSLSIDRLRESEAGMEGKARGKGTVSLPALREGEVAICFATLLARANPKGRSNLDYRTQEIASAVAQGQLAYYRLLEQRGECRILTDSQHLMQCAESWQSGSGAAPLGFVISMEGADPIVSPAQLSWWWKEGLRVVGLAHYGPSAYAHGTGCSGGLTPAGRELLRGMEDCGMILDLTHLADESFWEALDAFGGPVLASHNNCRTLVPGNRQFSDAQIRAIVERGGVIGAALDAWMLVPGWRAASPNLATLANVIDHIDHICQIAGNTRHAAIGSDLDGGFGTEQSPVDLDTIADLQKIPDLLRARGYSEEDIAAILHGNWMRVLLSAWQC